MNREKCALDYISVFIWKQSGNFVFIHNKYIYGKDIKIDMIK